MERGTGTTLRIVVQKRQQRRADSSDVQCRRAEWCTYGGLLMRKEEMVRKLVLQGAEVKHRCEDLRAVLGAVREIADCVVLHERTETMRLITAPCITASCTV